MLRGVMVPARAANALPRNRHDFLGPGHAGQVVTIQLVKTTDAIAVKPGLFKGQYKLQYLAQFTLIP